jgi:hypothetical protein
MGSSKTLIKVMLSRLAPVMLDTAIMRHFYSSLAGLVAILLGAVLCTACQGRQPAIVASSTVVSTLIPSPSATATAVPTDTPAPTETPVPTATPVPTLAPSPTPFPTLEIHPDVLDRILNPCFFLLHPVDAEYSNPQANLDPQTGLTWMQFTIARGVLQEGDIFQYWWDTRAFRADLSFNKGGGLCETLIETNQILCQGIPLRGTDNLPTGGYEYTISLYIHEDTCQSPVYHYQQRGLIFMDTLVHDVFYVNDEDAP